MKSSLDWKMSAFIASASLVIGASQLAMGQDYGMSIIAVGGWAILSLDEWRADRRSRDH